MFDTWYYDFAQDYYKFSIPSPQGSESISTETPATPTTTASVLNFGKYFTNDKRDAIVWIDYSLACIT